MNRGGAIHLLAELREQGIALWVEREQLKFRSPKGRMTAELKASVVVHRDELMSLLARVREERHTPIGARADAATAPLSAQQRTVWTAEQYGGAQAFLIPGALRLDGEMDAPALGQALQALCQRHEALRSSFHADADGQPVQRIAASVSLALPLVDLSELSDGTQQQSRLRELLADETARAFDLAQAPLLRAQLIRLSERSHVVCLCLHHIVADGWSIDILLRELSELYRPGDAGPPQALPRVLGYADYAAWQIERQASGADQAELDFWRKELAELPDPLMLSARATSADAPADYTGAVLRDHWSADMADQLRRLARDAGGTLFAALCASFSALLQRHAGQRDLLLGTAVAGRGHVEWEPVVGLFASRLPLRLRVDPGQGFVAHLDQVARRIERAFSHAELPAERLLGHALPQDAAGQELFRVMIVLQNVIRGELRLRGLRVSPIELPHASAKTELSLSFEEQADGGLVVELEYASHRFDAANAQALLEQLRRFTEAALAEPLRPLARLPLLSAAERAALLDFSAGNQLPPIRQTLWRAFSAVVAADPDAIALSGATAWGEPNLVRHSYAQLHERALRIADRLERAGAHRGDVVALSGRRSGAFVEGMLAIVALGAAYLPLDPELPATRIAAMRADASARLLLACDEAGLALADGFAACVALNAGDDEGAAPLARQRDEDGSPDDPLYVIFTSGTTGTPKGVLVSHANLLHFDAGNTHLPARGTYLHFISNVFDPSVMEIWTPLLRGAELLVAPAGLPDMDSLGELLQRHRVDVAALPAGLFQNLAEARPDALAALGHLMIGGDRLPLAAARAVYACGGPVRLYNCYGPTECTIGATIHPIDPAELREGAPPLSIGAAQGATRLYVLDEQGELAPPGAVGELYIGGDGVAAGYLGQPTLTAERFLPDPFSAKPGARMYRTGDLARWSDGRQLHFLGRHDRQVKIRGFRIELGELETHLSAHPSLAQVAIEALDLDGRKQLVAYLVAQAGQPIDELALREFLAARVPDYMLPAHWIGLHALPLTRNGKLDRAALPVPAKTHAADSAALEDERGRCLASVWRQLLRVEVVGADDNFYHLGGDSIIAMQASMRLTRLGWTLRPQQMLQHPRLREQAAWMRPLRAAVARRANQHAPLPPTPIQQWFFELPMLRRSHWNQALRLALAPTLVPRLADALAELERLHDALRLRFSEHGDGWRQRVDVPQAHGQLQLHRLREAGQAASLIEAAHRSLDIERGPVWRALLLEAPEWPWPHLFLVAHHLVIDGVSWRVLLGQLVLALRGEPLLEPLLGFADWAAHLASLPPSPPPPPALPAPPPLRDPAGANLVGDTVSLAVQLDAEASQFLLGAANQICASEPTELLLSGLLLGLHAVTGQRALSVALERHGRDAEEIDLSATVGWFTRIVPVRLALPEDASRELHIATLLALKQAARSAPLVMDAQAAGVPGVVFNYLGRLDHGLPDTDVLRAVEQGSGDWFDRQAQRPYAFEIVASAAVNGLRIDFNYSAAQAEPAVVEAWAHATIEALHALLAQLRQAEAARAPCDFPCSGIDEQTTLDALLAGQRLDPARLRDLLPASAQQRGMLLESMAHAGQGMHVEQFVATFEGRFDATALKASWDRLIIRHEALRSRFIWAGRSEPMCAVLDGFEPPWQTLDWRGQPLEPARLTGWLEQDRRAGFDFDTPPLRFTTVHLDAEHGQPARWLFIWTYHHALLDGWSVARLLEEAVQPPGTEPPPHSARDYIRWLASRDRTEAAAFWRAQLADFAAPAAIAEVDAALAPEVGVAELRRVLPGAVTQRLHELARRQAITPANIARGAFAMLQAWSGGRADVVQATTVAGRPSTLENSEHWIGLFINSLPLRLTVPSRGAAWDWLAEVARRTAALAPYEWCGGGEIQQWSGLSPGTPLGDALLVFENYPRQSGAAVADAPVVDIAGHGARTHFPLTLLVVPGGADVNHQWRCELIVDSGYLPQAQAGALLDAYLAILRWLSEPAADLTELAALLGPPPRRCAPGARAIVAPRSQLELALCSLWEGLFQGRPIGIDDHFFELGGHSLLVLELMARLRRQFGREVDFGDFLRDPTVAGLAALLGESTEQEHGARLLPLGGAGEPLFLLPGASGNPMSYLPLALALDGRLALQVGQPDLHTREELPDMQRLAAEFATAIAARQPTGALHLAGHSFGAVLAYAIATTLQAAGREVASLILIDQAPPHGDDPFAAMDEATLLGQIGEAMAVYFGRPLTLDVAALRAMDAPSRHRAVLAACQAAGILPASGDPAVIAAMLSIYQRSAQLQAAYTPSRWAGRLSVIRSADAPERPADLGWHALCDEVSCASAEGSHIGMITEPHVAGLADLILAQVATATGPSPSSIERT